MSQPSGNCGLTSLPPLIGKSMNFDHDRSVGSREPDNFLAWQSSGGGGCCARYDALIFQAAALLTAPF